jgi:hypothetical protein
MNKSTKAKHSFYTSLGIGVVVITGLLSGLSAEENEMDNGGGMLTMQGDKSLSGPEKLAWVERMLPVTRQVYTAIRAMLSQAEEERDTLKITCLDDKLNQVRVSLTGVEDRTASLRAALSSGRTVEVDQNFSILKIYVARILGLRSEAETCLGEADVVLGNTSTATSVDDKITTADPSTGDVPQLEGGASSAGGIPEIEVDPPEHASGFF